MLTAGLLAGPVFGQGPINVSETGLHNGESIYGIDGTLFSTPWTNSQIINLLGLGETDPNLLYTNVAFNAYGIYSSANLTNLAAIDVNGVGGHSYSDESTAYAFVNVYGIFGNPTGDVVVTNSGNITVASRGGIAEGDDGTSNAYATAYGISANHTLTNSGVIDVSSQGGTAVASNGYAYASAFATTYALRTNGNIVNEGQIVASATGGTATASGLAPSAHAYANAFGLYAYNGVQNTGDLIVSAVGGIADGGTSNTSASANAYGIRNSTGNVVNSGQIVASATGGSVSSSGSAQAGAFGIITGGNVNNSGDITVTATNYSGFVSEAYGIYMEESADLTNTGTIRAFGDSAYELYVAGGTTRLVNTYNVTLDGDPSNASIYVANGATLALNNAALTVTDVQAYDPAQATQFDTEYRLFETNGTGTVTGNFSSVSAVNPDVTAVRYTLGTANPADDTVALTYEPQASEAAASATIEKRAVALAPYAMNQHMTSEIMTDLLEPDDESEDDDGDAAGEGLPQTACQRAGGMFFQPHYSYIKRDNDPLGYNAGLTGVSTGYTQCVNNSLLGLHLGYGRSNIDYTGDGYNANTEDQEIVTSGFSGATRWRPWIARYGFTGFHGWHDYHGLTGLGLTEYESAEFNSYGGTGLVMVGRTFQRKQHVFLPELGANWLWVHREGYTTDATNPAWDTTYSTLDDHDIWGQANLHWQSLYRYKKLKITPAASIGIHQLLTDGETKVKQSVAGAAPVVVEDEQDETAVSLATSVVVRSRHTAVTLAYDGQFSSDIEEHNFWLKFKLRF